VRDRRARAGGVTPLPDAAALSALREGGVPGSIAERLAVYAALVLEANRRVNLTGAKDGAAFAAHIIDALTLSGDARTPLIDVGSGNGVPGIPLAIATGVSVTLLEPIKKRAAFLERAAAALGIDACVVPERAEDAARDPRYRERFATATARAVGALTVVAELTVPFVALGGRAVLQRGSVTEAERAALSDACLVLGATVAAERAAGPGRTIVVLEKVGATNARFPRRNGTPQRRPLCGG